jgi:hypothetical protein
MNKKVYFLMDSERIILKTLKDISIFQEASRHDVCSQEVDKREEVDITDI